MQCWHQRWWFKKLRRLNKNSPVDAYIEEASESPEI